MKLLAVYGLLAACALDTDPSALEDLETGTVESNLYSANKLSANKLAANKLAANKLAANKLAANKLAANKLAANSLHTEWLNTVDGRDVFSYAIKCAIPEGTTVQITISNVTYEFGGLLGLAPDWADKPLEAEGRAWISSCLLAHVNAFGVSVPISIRGDLGPIKGDAAEGTAFPFQEAAFFGDVFSSPQTMYGCLGWDGRNAYGASSPYLMQRACINGTPTNGTSVCGFTNVGWCEKVCANKNSLFSGPYSETWEDCYDKQYTVPGSWPTTAKLYPFVITVYLPHAAL